MKIKALQLIDNVKLAEELLTKKLLNSIYYRLDFIPISNTVGLSNYIKNMKDTFFLKSLDERILLD